jgi:Double zinc ribbon
MVSCPNCAQHTPSEASRCGHCNYRLPENLNMVVSAAATTRACWNCNHSNAVEAQHCEACNARQESTLKFALRPTLPTTESLVRIAAR